MQDKPIINLKRIRRIKGGFSFIPHRFLNEGFFESLSHCELVLYFFLLLVGDRLGMSWYGDPSITKHTGLSQDQLDEAKKALVEKRLIELEPPFVQVLELPDKAVLPIQPSPDNPASKILNSLKEKLND